jgi:hypothetical protein
MNRQTGAEPEPKKDSDSSEKSDTDTDTRSYGGGTVGSTARAEKTQQRAADAEKRKPEPEPARLKPGSIKPSKTPPVNIGATPAMTMPVVKPPIPTIDVIDEIIKDAKATDKATLEARISKLPKQDSLISRYKEKFKAYFNGGKGKLSTQKKNDWLKRGFLKRKKGGLGSGPIKYTISKRKLIAWAAVAGVAVWVMSKWLFDNGIEEENKTDGGGGSSDGGGSGGGTKYFDCNQFPYKKGCRSSIIGEVQKCLGIKVDNAFGNDTEKALASNKYGNEITDEVYKQIKSKCDSIVQPTTTTSTTTTTTLTPGQEYGSEPTPQEFEGGTQTSRINASEI